MQYGDMMMQQQMLMGHQNITMPMHMMHQQTNGVMFPNPYMVHPNGMTMPMQIPPPNDDDRLRFSQEQQGNANANN